MEKKLYEKIRKTNAAAGELRLRIEKLEKENGELTEKMKQLNADKDEERERNWNSQMEKVHSAVNRMTGVVLEGRNGTREEMKKLKTDIQYEIEAIVIENGEKTRTAIEAISSKMKKMTEDLSSVKYEIEAIVIENEEKTRTAISSKIEHICEMVESQKESLDQVLKEAATLEEIQAIPKGKETILLLGGGNDNNGSYDMTILKENRWIKLALILPRRLDRGGAVYLDGEIYIFGGSMEKALYKLDNKTLKWIRLADMNEIRWDINNSCLEWNGSIWVFGGRNNKDLKSVERYDPKENKWIKMPDMKYWRAGAAAAVHNGKFIVCGGDDGSNPWKSVECFDPESGVWTETNDMPTPLYGHSLVSYGNNLIVMGGWDGKTVVNTVLGVSNLEGKRTWKEPPMKQPRYNFSAAVLDNEIFVIGGDYEIGEDLDKTEIFNGNSWREGPFLLNKCRDMPSIVIPRHLADILYNSTE